MEFLTVKKAALQLGISTKRISLLCAQGRIKAERIGERLYLIEPNSLKEYQENPDRQLHRPFTLSSGRPRTKNLNKNEELQEEK